MIQYFIKKVFVIIYTVQNTSNILQNIGYISNTLISSFKYMYSMQCLVCVMFYHFYDLEDFISFAIIMQYIKDIISSLHVHYIVAHIQFPFIVQTAFICL